jgi:hypothetical protein
MHTRANYHRAFNVVRDVIHGWDEIPRINSQEDAACAVSRVFSSRFQPDGFSPADCAAVGSRLFSSLADYGLLADEL